MTRRSEAEPLDYVWKSVCSANDGLVTYIEPWKEEKLAVQYESRDCEEVTILGWSE